MRTKLNTDKPNITNYVMGYGLSLALTLAAYSLIRIHLNSIHTIPSDSILYYLLAVLAIVQLLVQLVFFIHLNRETKPRLNIMVALFAGLVVVVIVFGSLWIMSNLNNHGMTPDQTNNFIIKDEGIHY